MEPYAVGARELSRAEAFAKEQGFAKAYGSYEELVSDPEANLCMWQRLIPCTMNMRNWRWSMENVLCEKAFTMNAEQARDLTAFAEEKGLLLTEALDLVPSYAEPPDDPGSDRQRSDRKSHFIECQPGLPDHPCGTDDEPGSLRRSAAGLAFIRLILHAWHFRRRSKRFPLPASNGRPVWMRRTASPLLLRMEEWLCCTAP